MDGIPVVNKSGRYWVKLYSAGAEVKVEVDDRLPFASNTLLFPCTSKGLHLWPTIICKAVIKLLLSY